MLLLSPAAAGGLLLILSPLSSPSPSPSSTWRATSSVNSVSQTHRRETLGYICSLYQGSGHPNGCSRCFAINTVFIILRYGTAFTGLFLHSFVTALTALTGAKGY